MGKVIEYRKVYDNIKFKMQMGRNVSVKELGIFYLLQHWIIVDHSIEFHKKLNKHDF